MRITTPSEKEIIDLAIDHITTIRRSPEVDAIEFQTNSVPYLHYPSSLALELKPSTPRRFTTGSSQPLRSLSPASS